MPSSERGMNIDETKDWNEQQRYNVSQEAVESVFRRYGYHDHQVKFLPGFFNETFSDPKTELPTLAMIHVDVDSYDSVLDVLRYLYPKLSPSGYVIIDDFHLHGVRTAVYEYRTKNSVTQPLLPVPSDYIATCTSDLTRS